MSRLGRAAAVVALAALLLPAPAWAEELLVMPYTCSMAGGQPVLTPGPEQSHRIIGQREQRRHRACSPVNPDMCRTWTVHRFDLDCEGQRVSWVSVVAATHEGSRRAWLLDGRLLLRMGPRWSLAPDDPCAQDGPEDRPVYSSRLRRQCAERLAMAPPPVVEMPFGFAPMLGIDGIFVTAAPTPPVTAPSASKTLPSIVAGAPPPKSSPAETKPAPEPQREVKAGEPKPKGTQITPPVPMPVTPPVPQPASRATGPTPEVPSTPAQRAPEETTAPTARVEPKAPEPKLATPSASGKEPSTGSASPSTGPATGSSPVSHGPRVVSLSPAPPSQAVSEVPKKAASGEAPKPTDVSQTPAPTTAAKEAERRPAPPSKAGSQAKPEALPPEAGAGFLGMFRPTTTGAIVAFTGLALGLLTAFALARRREHARDVGRRRRDISALSLDGKQPKQPKTARASPQPASGPAADPHQASLPKPPDLMGRLAMTEAADWSDRMPRTRAEALEVLGIGIEPSASATALKKIVDGLRMSWHPDLAKDETDRALREHRSKQINAAWEILQDQRAVV